VARSLVVDGSPGPTCHKGWAYADYVTRLSAGAACAEDRFSSPLACPAVCRWDANRLGQAVCAGIKPPSGAGVHLTPTGSAEHDVWVMTDRQADVFAEQLQCHGVP